MPNIAATLSSVRSSPGASDEWCTPEVVLDRVRRIDGIGLDPCTNSNNPVDATWFCTPEVDGLAQRWGDKGLVFCNPPYSAVAAWAAKITAEAANGVEIVSLVAARPDSRWFFSLVWDTAQATCFWRGRLKFVGAPSSAPFPSVLIYHGPRPWRFEAAFHDAGKVLRL